MMDIFEPFQVYYEWHPDHSEEDQRKLIQQMCDCNQAIMDLLAGKVGLDYVCDMIAQHEMGVDDWIETTIDNLDYVTETGLIERANPEEVSTLITIPRWGYHLDDLTDAKTQISLA